MQEQHTDLFIYAIVALASVAAVMSSPQNPGGLVQQVKTLVFAGFVSDAAAADALSDARQLVGAP